MEAIWKTFQKIYKNKKQLNAVGIHKRNLLLRKNGVQKKNNQTMKKEIMKIGIIGSGNIGGNLGKHWAKAGHEVLFTSRHPEKLTQLALDAGGNSKAVSLDEAWEANADVYLLAVPFVAIDELAEHYAGEYGNKIIIDATNPYPERDGQMAQDVRDSNH